MKQGRAACGLTPSHPPSHPHQSTAKETLTRVRTAARAAARAAQRTGRALEPATHATALPGDVLRHIAQLLPRTDILSMACVCTAWKEMLVALPSPLFPSVSVGIDALLSGSEALPAYNDLLARSNDILSLRVRGCVLKREFAFVSTLVTQLTRLTSLALEHDATPTSRPEWTQGVFRAAAAACPGLTAVEMTFGAGRGAAHRRRPISGSLFSGLGADALGA